MYGTCTKKEVGVKCNFEFHVFVISSDLLVLFTPEYVFQAYLLQIITVFLIHTPKPRKAVCVWLCKCTLTMGPTVTVTVIIALSAC